MTNKTIGSSSTIVDNGNVCLTLGTSSSTIVDNGNVCLTLGTSGAGVVKLSGGSMFHTYPPKADGITVVKLTKDNLKEVGAYLIKKRGGTVQVTEEGISFGPIPEGMTPLFLVGDWMVEDYDYVAEKNVYREASIIERQKYDLR